MEQPTVAMEDVDPQAWEDQQLALAIALSLADQPPSHSLVDLGDTHGPAHTTAKSFLSERAEMEMARLARQKRHFVDEAAEAEKLQSPGAGPSRLVDPESHRPAKRL